MGLHRDRARIRTHSPNLGVVALSTRSRAESRAPLGARERPPSPAGAQAGAAGILPLGAHP